MPTKPITPRELENGAEMARDLDVLLSRAVEQKALPLLIGYNLDHLADEFDAAAKEMRRA